MRRCVQDCGRFFSRARFGNSPGHSHDVIFEVGVRDLILRPLARRRAPRRPLHAPVWDRPKQAMPPIEIAAPATSL